jgi:multicomponent Na+:H+ antiporter subunit D
MIPILIIVPIMLFRKSSNLRETFSISGSLFTFLSVCYLYTLIKDGKIIECTILEFLPGLSLKLKVDSFGILFALMSSFLWFLTTFYSTGYMRGAHEKKQTRFFIFFTLSMFATLGAAFSGNLVTLYVFYEMLTFFTYPLVAHKQTKEAIQGARRYLSFLLITSIMFLLPAIIYIYSATGQLEFVHGGIIHNTNISSKTMMGIMLLFFVFGSAKAAIMPFHLWLPSAMIAPTPVSALLHAVAVVKTGVFVIIRVFVYIYGTNFLKEISSTNLITIIASFTIIAASMVALRQNNIKAILAYSTISQLSYIVLAVSLLNASGTMGAIIHIIAHGFGKITLFFWAGAVYIAAHKTKVSELNGIAKSMPFSMAAFTIGALSMIGFPPMGGLISKWFIANGAIKADKVWVLVILIISALLNASYFVPIFIKAYFGKTDAPEASKPVPTRINEAPMLMTIPLLVTSCITIVLFFYPEPLIRLAKVVAIGGG